MADTSGTSRPAAPRSTTALVPAGVDDASAVRSRSRKTPTYGDSIKSPRLTPGQSPVPSRGVSPMPTAHLGNSKLLSSGRSSPSSAAFSRGLLEGSWTPSWASVQDFASSLLEGGYNSEPSRPSSSGGNKQRPKSIWKGFGVGNTKSGKSSSNWGPAPPAESRPAAKDIAAGSLAEREAQLKARKTASVLESYEGVNGGLDVSGKYKRRNSDETPRDTSEPVIEEQLVYLHHVQPTDTYAGIVLRYRCQEQAFRKTNGLWSRDNIQIRKHLMIPVDACETKGRPCDPPSQYSQQVDLLATTPQPTDFASPFRSAPPPQQTLHDSYFESVSSRSAGKLPQDDEEQPWTHVRWVKLDFVQEPIEIVRVSRKSMGYFPPRRKKSIHTTSTFSTPRHSLELSKTITNTSEAIDSPGRLSTRRPSSLSARPTPASLGTSSSARSRVTSLGEGDSVPVWMRRPGGVGSMSRSVKAPGPAKDYFNTWVNKRLPGFNIDSMPSMSVMGSETAHFGFNHTAEEAAGIVESPFEEGREATSLPRNGMGLEHAAASIETWLRGAWARRPSTPRLGSHRRPLEDLDLIELADTNSDDGRMGTLERVPEAGLLNQNFHGTTGRSEGEGSNKMPICIECRHPVKTLWTAYSGAGDPSSGHNIRLTVYRHLLHNTLMRDRDQFDPSIIRLGTLLLLFDVYLTWARIEKQAAPDPGAEDMAYGSNLGSLARQPIVFQYMFFLILCTFSTFAFHMSIRFLTSSPLSPLTFLGLLPTYARPNSVSTALLVSSSTKLFPILMVIWDYDVPAAARSLGWAVVANNVEALKILLDCGYGVALVLAAAGAVARWVVGRSVLWVVGLEGVDSMSESGVAADGRALWALLMYAREWAGRLAVG
ncbi:carbohydrate-binding module family 50 protein [Hypoxylon rubiginosum]|uniref:Carbohydrate-binding module family 50 protein n=1 Tax=Hypoxylon rubiginosum TaxID=110542 RepID=A0ACC0D609_9PEZI|nr:carbohydrate-binding module family 50 protein [Hypoxylon rubiginosum]